MLNLRKWTIKNYNQNKTVLENIDLDFFKNQFTAIIALSGTGKTTLLNSIVFATNIIDGELIFDDKKINFKKDKKDWRKNIGIISQKNTLINESSVFDNLKIVMSNRNNFFFKLFNIITKEQKTEIIQILEKINMLDKIYYLPKDLSGGESQKIQIAKLLIQKPKIVLADEPTSNLDNKNSEEILNLLKKFTYENNTITIVNIHNTNLLNIFDRIIGVKNKVIILDKTNSKITENDIKKVYE